MELAVGAPPRSRGVAAAYDMTATRPSFDRLFEEYQHAVYNYVLRMVGDRDRADDITQDTFIKAYRRLHTLTDDAAVRPWLYRIATNTAIDEIRRRRFSFGDAYPDRADDAPGPEAQAMASRLDDAVQRALMQLRPNHRQCLVLSDIEDMSGQQIAEVMGISYGAVRTLLCRARGEMRALLVAAGVTR
ncbi:MAG: sigma-70 family RNA polymerase sigma factor [Chloroflexota bacterium]|nr:sigma-70 family RNA polymerase sigma factor [Chloroflexota bacterium]